MSIAVLRTMPTPPPVLDIVPLPPAFSPADADEYDEL